MRKVLLLVIVFLLFPHLVSANYKLDNGSKEIVERFELSQYSLSKEISRKEFVESLYSWYGDYRKERGLYVDYNTYNKLDNTKYFTDVNLESDFGKKLQYFAHLGAFSKNEYFDPKGTVNQKVFFIVMKRLRIMSSLQQCKNLRICEKEADDKNYFNKGVYYKYLSKIFDRKLRKYYTTPQQYLEAGYKPYLSPSYYFPNMGQNLNGCYAFSVRNILKYKHGIGVYIPKVDKYVGRAPTSLRTYPVMKKYDKAVHVDARKYWSLDTVMTSLQAGEPVSLVYWWHYTDWKTKKKKKVKHIVTAYSFDKNGLWVAETISARRILIPYDEIFDRNGNAKVGRIFKYYYDPKENWSESEKELERNNNFLANEK